MPLAWHSKVLGRERGRAKASIQRIGGFPNCFRSGPTLVSAYSAQNKSDLTSLDKASHNVPMTEIRVRNLDDAVAEALEAAAKHAGRSLESHVREILKEASRSGIGDFPQASDWVRSGFDEVHELIPGRQYLAWAAMTPYRITITRSVTGEDPEWNTLIEEAVQVPDRDGAALSVWARATDVDQRLLGTSPGMALRVAIHWVAE